MDPKHFEEARAYALIKGKPLAPLTAQLEDPQIPFESLIVVTD